MGTVKKGILVSPGERWKHMDCMKRPFWKRQRRAEKRDIQARLYRDLTSEKPSE